MKKCKICHVEAELVDGRCQSCRRAKEATDRGMSYGQLVAEIDPPKVREVRDRTATCEWCGAIFLRTKRRTKYCSTECENKASTKPIDQAPVVKKAIQPKACVVCGRMFIPVKNDARVKYCSNQCRNKTHMRLYLERKRRAIEGSGDNDRSGTD